MFLEGLGAAVAWGVLGLGLGCVLDTVCHTSLLMSLRSLKHTKDENRLLITYFIPVDRVVKWRQFYCDSLRKQIPKRVLNNLKYINYTLLTHHL